MLANDPTNPRPRPPAQLKRSTTESKRMKKSSSSPPPSYASSLTFPHQPSATLLGSPVSATMQLVDGANQDMAYRLSERSQEELTELLLKADGVIKQRENELDRTSSLYKTLYQDNTSLRSKHKALLSRIPLTPTRVPSPLPSPASTTSSISDPFQSLYSPSSPASTYPTSNPGSRFSPSPVTQRHRPTHCRKISVTSSEITHLADQNAELLSKIEQLEAENASTDLAGRRMLRRLEKEIGSLRQELESVRDLREKEAEHREEHSHSLHNSTNSNASSGCGGTRINRFIPGRKPREDTDAETSPVKDFAPGGALSHSSSSAANFFSASGSQHSLNSPVSASFSFPTSLEEISEEHTLLTHLLSKMAELEQTNTRILVEQAETAKKLAEVQRETVSLGKVYEGLEGEEVIIEEDSGEDRHSNSSHNDVSDKTMHAAPTTPNETIVTKTNTQSILRPHKSRHESDTETIRFRSFRRSLLESMIPMEISELKEFGTSSIPSKAAITSTMKVNTSSSGHNPRKSIFGVFETPEGTGSDANANDTTSENDREGPISPALSSLSLSIHNLGPSSSSLYSNTHSNPQTPSASQLCSPTDSDTYTKTTNSRMSGLPVPLASEMGGFGFAWDNFGGSGDGGFGVASPSHHLRTSSLYDLRFGGSEPPSPSPSVSSSRIFGQLVEEKEKERKVDERKEEGLGLLTGKEFEGNPGSPSKAQNPQLTLEPPTPVKFPSSSDAGVNGVTPSPSPISKERQQERYRKMSQTVRMRTARWVDGRFGDRESLLGPQSPNVSPGTTPSSGKKTGSTRGSQRWDASQMSERDMGSVSGKGKGKGKQRMFMPVFDGEGDGDGEDSDQDKDKGKATPTNTPTPSRMKHSSSSPVPIQPIIDLTDESEVDYEPTCSSKSESGSEPTPKPTPGLTLPQTVPVPPSLGSRQISISGMMPASMSNAFDSMMDKFTRSVSGNGILGPMMASPGADASTVSTGNDSAIEKLGSHPDGDVASSSSKLVQLYTEPRRRQRTRTKANSKTLESGQGSETETVVPTSTTTIGSVILELWLWLQFVVIILVFLWAMAKKGPKSILVDGGSGSNGKR